jgi:RNA polymerase sigma-70 factor (ECF subfamily)
MIRASRRSVHVTISHPTEATQEDVDLVRQMAAGVEEALAALYDRHARTLMAAGMHVLRDAADAEDVVHDVFLEAWRKATSYDPRRGTVRAWLLVRMRSRCLDRLRAAAVRRDVDPHEVPVPAAAVSPNADAWQDDGDRVVSALHQLPEGQREVMQLIYVRGMTSQQAGAALGVPTGTVKSRVRLALRALRQVLRPETET